MHKSSSEILRQYAQIVSEAQGDTWPEEYNPNDDELAIDDKALAGEDENAIDLPDESMMDKYDQKFENDWDDPEIPNTNPGDPAGELASFLGTDADKINEFLRKHNLELTPVGGLANSKGNI